MEEPLVILGVGSFVVLVVLVLMLSKPQRRTSTASSLAAQDEIEQTDIDQMIEARNALRARLGRPPLADDLVEQLRRDLEGDDRDG